MHHFLATRNSSMPTRKAIICISTIALIGAAVAWTIWLRQRRGLSQTRHLSDGSVLHLKRASYQKPYRIRTGTRWQDYLGVALSDSLAKKLDARFVTAGGRTNALDFWLEWSGFPASRPALRAATFDEHGCEFGLTSPDHSLSVGRAEALVFQFTEFPRRSKDVGFRLYQRETNYTWSKIAEFHVTNPNPRAYPVWQGEPLPITRSISNADITLVELKTGILARTSPAQPAIPGEHPGAAATFRLSQNGRPTSAWELADFKGITDACGQTVARGGYAAGMTSSGNYRVIVDGGLCVEEAAWKVEAEFARAADFPNEELWTIRAIAVPKKNSATSMDATTNLYGSYLEFRGVSSVGHPAPLLRRSLANEPVAHVVCTNLASNLQLKFVRAVDDRGRNVSNRGRASDPPNHVFGLALPADARTIDLTFAVTRRVPVQYLVKPSQITASELKKLKR